MTGYNVAHGDTAAVRLDLDNDYDAYKTYMGIIERTAWFDEEDSTWNDVEKAADRVKAYVSELGGGDEGAYGEIRDADLNSVDWVEIVTDVLQETNLQDKRDRLAGLSEWITDGAKD